MHADQRDSLGYYGSSAWLYGFLHAENVQVHLCESVIVYDPWKTLLERAVRSGEKLRSRRKIARV